MKKTILSAALIAASAVCALATTTTTTTTVYGKNTGTTVVGTTAVVNCDNTYPWTCFTTTVTTSDEEVAGTLNPGDPITINPYDQKGNPTQQTISGIYVSGGAQQDPNAPNTTDYYYTLNFQQ